MLPCLLPLLLWPSLPLAPLQEGYDAAKKAVSDATENVKEGAQDLGDRITGDK
jgi:hypothetical protein